MIPSSTAPAAGGTRQSPRIRALPAEDNRLSDHDDKALPLREDIRLLGRLLGDTVREQEGEAAFGLIERIRRSSIAFHRDQDRKSTRLNSSHT